MQNQSRETEICPTNIPADKIRPQEQFRPGDRGIHLSREEKVKALVFKVFWLRLQTERDFLLIPCYSTQVQSKELSSWASDVEAENNTSVHAITYDSSTEPSICLTSFLQWQTAPQSFAMIAEPFQLKDIIQTHACYLGVSLTASHPLEDFERATHLCFQLVPLEAAIFSSFWGEKAI